MSRPPGSDRPGDPEQDTFEVFLVRQRRWLEQQARSLAAQTGADHHALFSDTVVVLHRKWADLVPPRERTGRAYARTVMAGRLRDLGRSGRARLEHPSDDVGALLERRLPPDQWADDPEFEVLSKERRTRIHRAIRALPERERSIIALRTQDHGFAAIAELLGLEDAQVRNAMLRARRALRILLEEGDDDDR